MKHINLIVFSFLVSWILTSCESKSSYSSSGGTYTSPSQSELKEEYNRGYKWGYDLGYRVGYDSGKVVGYQNGFFSAKPSRKIEMSDTTKKASKIVFHLQFVKLILTLIGVAIFITYRESTLNQIFGKVIFMILGFTVAFILDQTILESFIYEIGLTRTPSFTGAIPIIIAVSGVCGWHISNFLINVLPSIDEVNTQAATVFFLSFFTTFLISNYITFISTQIPDLYGYYVIWVAIGLFIGTLSNIGFNFLKE